MLVLTRKPNQSFVIGDNIRIEVISIGHGKVQIGIDAPKDVVVDRLEVHNAKKKESK